MNKPEIAQRIANRSKVTPAEAADRLDRLVCQIITDARKGRSSTLPGLGVFDLDDQGVIRFEREGEQPHGIDGKE